MYVLVINDVGIRLRRHGVMAVPQYAGWYTVPEWAAQLYDACFGADGYCGPWTGFFEYAVERAVKEPEFCAALIAALDGDVLVPFVNQQRSS